MARVDVCDLIVSTPWRSFLAEVKKTFCYSPPCYNVVFLLKLLDPSNIKTDETIISKMHDTR